MEWEVAGRSASGRSLGRRVRRQNCQVAQFASGRSLGRSVKVDYSSGRSLGRSATVHWEDTSQKEQD